MKKYMLICMLLIAITGCSSGNKSFDDKDISFKLINVEATSEFRSYVIEIKNNAEFELTHLNFYLSYPIKQQSGSKSNPFLIEGKTDKRPISLMSGESVQFTIFAPIKEVFSDSNLLNFEHPDIDLKGYVKQGNKEIPFQMGGGLEVFIR
jgi:hypothetical protein